MVENVVVTLPAVPGGVGAAYFTIGTNNDPSQLQAIASPRIQRMELHETREQGGQTGMRQLPPPGITFSPGEPLRFAPGGKHAMLFGVDPSLRPGDKVLLSFTVQPLRDPVTVEADVRGPGQVQSDH
jgi:copper(I)-binding protein